MDSLEVNKVIAAVLAAGIAFMATGLIGEKLVHAPKLKKQAIQIAGAPAETGTAPAAPEKAPPIVPLLASADPAKGHAVADKDCTVCHSFGQGEPAKIGPNLYGIVGDKRAHMAGFDYSAGLKKLGGTWTYDNLDQWLFDPHSVLPDTRMSFPGIKNTKDRADVIAWLRTLSPHPEPLPSAEEVKAAEAAGKAAAAPPAAEQKAAQAAPPKPGFAELVAAADPAKGHAIVERDCTICHSFGKGEPAKIGPNLYGIVGDPRARTAGFDYTAGLKKLGGTWTYDNLSEWLTDPMKMVPGTHMIFPGIKSEKERAEVVAYLRTLSDHPEPLPKPAGAPAAAGAAQQPETPAAQSSGHQAPAGLSPGQETQTEKTSGSTQPANPPQAGAPAPTPALQKP